MITRKTSFYSFSFITTFVALSPSATLYPSQVNSLSASQSATATSAASTSTLSTSATSSSSVTNQNSATTADSKNKQSSASATTITVTVVLSASFRDTFTLPKSNFELLQKIFKLTKLSKPGFYAVKNCYEYDAVRVAFNCFSRDEDKAESYLRTYIDSSEDFDADNARRTWKYILDKTALFGEEIGDPSLEKNPRLQRFCQILQLAMY